MTFDLQESNSSAEFLTIYLTCHGYEVTTIKTAAIIRLYEHSLYLTHTSKLL